MGPLALQGIRIVDLTWVWAGPHATEVLADMGAEVIKVESPAKPPDGRTKPQDTQLNRNKYSILLDLTKPRGKQVFKDLVSISDIVIENFSYGVMNRLGLGYAALKEIKPDIIVVSMPSYGNAGPLKHYFGFGNTMESLSGILWPTGYRGGIPMSSGVLHIDPTTGGHAAGAMMAALFHRRRTGRGQYVDLSHVQSAVTIGFESIMEHLVNKRPLPRIGNRHSFMAPHGCYRCQGEDRWVAIAVSNEDEWQALCQVMGNPALAQDARFADALSRHQNQDDLDQIIGAWSGGLDHYEAMNRLQKAGVPAGAVLDCEEIAHEPHLRERELVIDIKGPRDETPTRPHLGLRWKYSKTPGEVRKPAPVPGENFDYVLGNVLKMSKEEIESLVEEKVVVPPREKSLV